MCGECERITLADCACEDAAKERTKIAARVETIGVGTPERDRAAHATALSEYVARFGSNAEVRHAKLHAWLDPLVTLVAVLAGAIAVFVLVERLRSARAKSGTVPPTKRRVFKSAAKRQRNKR
jgi:hypothetical protein